MQRWLSGCFLLIAFGALSSCSSDSPVANADDILTLEVSPKAVLSQGDTAIVTARLTTSDGRPVFDGTPVQFSATAGSIDNTVETINGVAEAVFISGLQIGEVTISARSGSIGLEEPISTTLEVQDRNIPIGSILVSTNPSNLTARGGIVTLTAVVLDENGIPLPDKSVVFASSFGRTSSNGLPRITDARGTVQDTLQVSALPPDTSTITITVQAGSQTQTAEISISQNESPTPVLLFSPSEPRIGETVFFDGSLSSDPEGAIAEYIWNFGDGNQAEGRLVEHVYQKAGTYTISLLVIDSDQAAAAEQSTITIGNNQPPQARFSFSPQQPRTRQTIQFNGSSSTDEDGTITQYEWDLGNGVVRTGRIIQYAYADAGTYGVTLSVTDDNGVTAVSETVAVTVVGNQAPTAAITVSNNNPLVDQLVSFNGSESSDPDGVVQTYLWDFGDGSTETGASVTHTYRQVGTFLVTLQVIDNETGSGFATTTINVGSGQAPTASFDFSPSSPKVNELVNFNASASSDPDGVIRTYRWTFGDGANASGKTVAHSYFAPGSYTVTLEVTDDRGLSSTTTTTLNISSGATPSASLVIRPSAVPEGRASVLLDATGSSDADDRFSELNFTFEGFGPPGVVIGIADGLSPLREAQLLGLSEGDQISFTVRVTDGDGNRDFAVANLQVTNGPTNQTPIARLTLTPENLTPPGGQIILNAAASTDGDHALEELKFSYNFLQRGDFKVNYKPNDDPLQIVTIDEAEDGDILTVLLTVTDPEGAQDTETVSLSISQDNSNNQAPRPAFSISPSSPSIGSGTLVINGDGTQDPDNNFGELTFNYQLQSTGDTIFTPSTLTEAVGEVQYTGAVADEIITVFLTVTDPEGATGTLSRTVTVADAQTNSPPVANLVVTPTNLSEPGGTVILNATGTVDPDHETDELTFAYEVATTNTNITLSNLGNTSFEELTITGADEGDTIVILLQVTDPEGANDVITRNITITAP